MLSLALQILFGAGFSVGVKAASIRKRDMIYVGGLNYIAAALLCGAWLAGRHVIGGGAVSVGRSGAVFGTLNGVGYFAAYFFLVKGIQHQGLAATRAVGGLAVLLPVLASMLVWGEQPSVEQGVGALVAAFSAALLDSRRNLLGEIKRGMWIQMLFFFMLSGGSRVAAKAFNEAEAPDEKLFYTLMVYVSSGLFSVVMLAFHKRKPRAEEFFWGLCVGTCNMLQVVFMLRALEEIPGIIAFPTAAAGGLIVSSLSAAALGERPSGRVWSGVGASAAAVILLNWKQN